MRIVSPDPRWPAVFDAERAALVRRFPDVLVEHIGSTAIPGLVAKPIVDMLVGAADTVRFAAILDALPAAGWVVEGRRADHAWLCKPDPADRAVIAHLVLAGGPVWRRRLAFRDHLRAHPDLAAQYENLKRRLAVEHAGDITAYTRAKAQFVHDVLVVAMGSGAR